jgi:hypothetical protein
VPLRISPTNFAVSLRHFVGHDIAMALPGHALSQKTLENGGSHAIMFAYE